jgi:uncharacterized protein (DUF427 family)
VDRPVKTPGPDHPIEITLAQGVFEAVFAGEVVARSARALLLREADRPAVVYFPRNDVRMDLFSRSATRTWCPYKGEASYFSLKAADGAAVIADAGWSYEAPLDAMTQIAGCIAFYSGKADVRPA